MPSFHNGAVEIAYLDEGEGDRSCWCTGFCVDQERELGVPGLGFRS